MNLKLNKKFDFKVRKSSWVGVRLRFRWSILLLTISALKFQDSGCVNSRKWTDSRIFEIQRSGKNPEVFQSDPTCLDFVLF